MKRVKVTTDYKKRPERRSAIRFQDTFIINNSKKSIDIFIRFLRLVTKRENYLWDYHFWLGVARCASCLIKLQNYLIISIPGINHLICKFFCMELVINLQGKVTKGKETKNFRWFFVLGGTWKSQGIYFFSFFVRDSILTSNLWRQ